MFRHFENIYIGWGLKAVCSDFNPANHARPCEEANDDQFHTESVDPTREEEQAFEKELLESESDEEETLEKSDGL